MGATKQRWATLGGQEHQGAQRSKAHGTRCLRAAGWRVVGHKPNDGEGAWLCVLPADTPEQTEILLPALPGQEDRRTVAFVHPA
jgi:hypothetical protein